MTHLLYACILDEKLEKIEAQLIAECVAAFQSNQAKVPSLTEYTFPCIILNGLCPYFYQIKVTTELSELIKQGLYCSCYCKALQVLLFFRSSNLRPASHSKIDNGKISSE